MLGLFFKCSGGRVKLFKKRKHISSLMLILFAINSGLAQQDSSVWLKAAQVLEYRTQTLSAGVKIETIDSIKLNQYKSTNLGELLSEQSSVYIKSQGPGNLATTSFRGGSSSHTAIIWNGFNINNSMNGLVDLSLIPVSLSDQISIQYGPSTALWGSGALGGAILLGNRNAFKSGLSVDASSQTTFFRGLEELNGSSQNVAVSYGGSTFYGSLKIFNQQSDNEYPFGQRFIDQIDGPQTENYFADNRSTGVATDLAWKINKHHILDFHYWYQDAYRNIPPIIFGNVDNEIKANIGDKTHRLSFHYAWIKANYALHFRSAYFNKNLLYNDQFLGDSPSITENYINEFNFLYNPNGNSFIELGLNNNFNIGKNKNYADVIDDNNSDLVSNSQNSLALIGSYCYKDVAHKMNYSVNLRQELIDGDLVPFTFSLGWDYKVLKTLILQANLAKVYRNPNLNDLYWNPGGNPDLKSENGYSGEIGGEIEFAFKNGILKLGVTEFYRRVSNWIQWTPGVIWSPENLLEVESYGTELRPEISYQFNKVKVNLGLHFAYTISHNIKSNTNTEGTLNNQLIYTPIYSGNAFLSAEYKQLGISYTHNYTGYTYTATDHSQFINPYDVGSVRLSYNKSFSKKLNLNIYLSVNNLYGEAYEVVLGRPMPLTYYNFGIQLHFNQKQSK